MIGNRTALIVIDTGFSAESMVGRIIKGFYDVRSGCAISAASNASSLARAELERFAGDPKSHGSRVLERLTGLLPHAPVILIRAFDDATNCLRTRWQDGKIAVPGWTEAYRWAVGMAKREGWNTVANCSFGSATHAVDGTGWEAFQLGQETGAGKSGHIVVAAAGPGDGRAVHASWHHMPALVEQLYAEQNSRTVYNLWVDREVDPTGWSVKVRMNGNVVMEQEGRWVPRNMWNQRQQLTFAVDGAGEVNIEVTRCGAGGSDRNWKFECWCTSGDGRFCNYVDTDAVMEPAIFPHVLAVGLEDLSYGKRARQHDGKPDVLLPGTGELSFRIPEVTAAVANLLSSSEEPMDVNQVRALLGKYPDVTRLLRR